MEQASPRRPDRHDQHDGLAYTLWLPDSIAPAQARGRHSRGAPPPPWPGVVVVHGAGSCKENHADFARLAAANGWAALVFDQRGHGASEGEMGPDALGDVTSVARLLATTSGVDPGRIALRGSSMGGFIAIHAAAGDPAIAGVIAVCPAGEEHLAQGLRRGELEMRVGDPVATELWLTDSDLGEAVERLSGRPLFLMHAEGDDEIPAAHSEELFDRAGEPRRLLLVPGGDHH
ncbi:MAG: alpha/beta fold hydrolase, partial [Actinomycetota bacterium]|nr:alpha/beta fold hydrolase [Actinomycetota bacterium]